MNAGLRAGAACLLLLVGCAARQPAAPPAPSADRAAPPTAPELIGSVAARRLAVQSMRAQARLAYTSPQESRRAKQILLAARPDRLRLEVLSPFGAVFVMAARDGTLAAWDRGEATVYRGAASPGNLGRYASVDLPVAAAVDLLLGTPPLDERAPSYITAEGDRVRLWQSRGAHVQVTWFSSALDPLSFEEQDDAGHVLLRVTFADYRDVPGGRIPTRISIEQPVLQRQIDIELRDPEVNPALADAAFALDTPPGAKEVHIDRVVN